MPDCTRQPREVTFAVLDDHLVRTVQYRDGGGYQHRCSKANYEAVAHAAGATPPQGDGLALGALADELRLPQTQVNVALEFLKERGVLVTRGRRSYPASNFAAADAMIEYHALREKGPGGDD